MNIVQNASPTHNFFAARMNLIILKIKPQVGFAPTKLSRLLTKQFLLSAQELRRSKNHHIYASDWDQLQPCHIFFMGYLYAAGFEGLPPTIQLIMSLSFIPFIVHPDKYQLMKPQCH